MGGLDQRVLDGIRVMAAVVDSRSFGRAGEALDMSQSGVSRAIARLEEQLGLRLFDRTTRSVRMTDEGRSFYEQVMPLIASLDAITASASGNAKTINGRLRVNVDPFFSRLILGPRLGAFLQSHPGLQLELITRDELGDMITDGFDVAIRFGHPRNSALVARKLLETRIITAAAPAYIQRYGLPKEPRDLESGSHVCIQFRDPETGRPFPWEFHQRRKKIVFNSRGQLTVNEAGTMQSVCVAGHGIGQILELGAEQFFAERKLVNLFPDWSDERFPLYAYYPSRHHVPAKTRALLDFVANLVQ
ncbi:LysR family transcriptional regulator [Trinickia sp. LjRoot230]|uniref:LysR family transcriptional regulator n=1 Tax=Trinickia sp. LjRoot230 TaxID=3342288 RepID=UPI003ECC39E7